MFNWFRKIKPKVFKCSIGEPQIRALIRGGQVTFVFEDRTQVHLLLQDVGYNVLVHHVNDARVKGVKGYSVESVVVQE